jgi:DNA-binding LacI/PurR family transcriptional regulator
VSRAAASLALRGKPGVAELTRRRILDVRTTARGLTGMPSVPGAR